MSAENTKIVLLTGTPIINYPNEISIMMNILRGYIQTWSFKLSINDKRKVNQEFLINLFKSNSLSNSVLDYLEYNPTTNMLLVTRNPYGFNTYIEPKSKTTSKKIYDGVILDSDGNLDNDAFEKIIVKILLDNNIMVIKESIMINSSKCIPDTKEDFAAYFIKQPDEIIKDIKNGDKSTVKNMNLFKRRILGLVSYFPDIEALLPKYDRSTDLNIIEIPMSDFQFGVYEEARVAERIIEQSNAKTQGQSDVYEESSSTYRIFSRAFCNFVFPRPDIKRPMPQKDGDISTIINIMDENIIDAVSDEDKLDNVEGRYDTDESLTLNKQSKTDTKKYEERIKIALEELENESDKYLTPIALQTYSPKFLNILERIIDPEHEGLHLIYSQFRTLEGIGILSLILKANGFAQFKIFKVDGEWKINIPIEDSGKPKFVLYTGSETQEEKEIIRNIFNGDLEIIPSSLRTELEAISSNNLYGEIIKIIMITASGAEGISLKNVRYVHITEPYWHPVRMEQVIGRARRICSHKDLPKKLQTVEVFLYLMSFSKKQLSDERALELKSKDTSKLDKSIALTSDQALFEISTIKENVNKDILHNIKEASIDCNIHTKFDSKEKLQCFAFGSASKEKFSYVPNIEADEKDDDSKKNKIEKKISVVSIKIPGVGAAALNKETNEVYDLDSFKRKKPVVIGNLVIDSKGNKLIS